MPIQDPGRYILPEFSELFPTRLRMTIVFLDLDFRCLRLFICPPPQFLLSDLQLQWFNIFCFTNGIISTLLLVYLYLYYPRKSTLISASQHEPANIGATVSIKVNITTANSIHAAFRFIIPTNYGWYIV